MEDYAPSPGTAVVAPSTQAAGRLPDVDPAQLPLLSLEDVRELHRLLLARLRDVEHWHRLVAARLDLCVAAVADLDEPLPVAFGCDADDLHALLGIPHGEGRLAESGRLLGLRTALRELDLAGCALQAQLAYVGQELARRSHARAQWRLPRQRETS